MAACNYNPPPDIDLGCRGESADDETVELLLGEPIPLCFSEPIRPESLEIRVWPGRLDTFDIEGERLPHVEPILDTCTLASSPCGAGGGVDLTIDAASRMASMRLTNPGALGPLAQPLQMEVTGRLADTNGQHRKVSRFFAFQIVAETWNPYADTATGVDVAQPIGDAMGEVADGADVAPEDVPPPEPLGVAEGVHLFCANFTDPMELAQQFFGDFQVNQLTGDFVAVLVDADPTPGSPANSCVPGELRLDTGEQGFLFTVRGKITRDPADGGLLFVTDFVTLVQSIGITFELVDMVLRGRITIDEASGRSRWDGTMAVRQVILRVGEAETIYDDVDPANFQIYQLHPDEVPEGTPSTCDADPCTAVGGKCDLLPGVTWPPDEVCSFSVDGAL